MILRRVKRKVRLRVKATRVFIVCKRPSSFFFPVGRHLLCVVAGRPLADSRFYRWLRLRCWNRSSTVVPPGGYTSGMRDRFRAATALPEFSCTRQRQPKAIPAMQGTRIAWTHRAINISTQRLSPVFCETSYQRQNISFFFAVDKTTSYLSNEPLKGHKIKKRVSAACCFRQASAASRTVHYACSLLAFPYRNRFPERKRRAQGSMHGCFLFLVTLSQRIPCLWDFNWPGKRTFLFIQVLIGTGPICRHLGRIPVQCAFIEVERINRRKREPGFLHGLALHTFYHVVILVLIISTLWQYPTLSFGGNHPNRTVRVESNNTTADPRAVGSMDYKNSSQHGNQTLMLIMDD